MSELLLSLNGNMGVFTPYDPGSGIHASLNDFAVGYPLLFQNLYFLSYVPFIIYQVW